MLMKIIIASCLVALVVIPATEAFGIDFLEWLLGEDSESEESSETVISAKPNTTVMVVCQTSCNLNVMCVNCMKIDSTMMSPTNGNGGSQPGNGATQPPNGNGMTSSTGNAMMTASATSTTPAVDGTPVMGGSSNAALMVASSVSQNDNSSSTNSSSTTQAMTNTPITIKPSVTPDDTSPTTQAVVESTDAPITTVPSVSKKDNETLFE